MVDKTIVITGASDGIGAAAARQLSAQGEHVVIVGRSPEKTRQVADAPGVPYHLADFEDLEQVKSLAATLLERYPQIDVLANNAGGVFTRLTTKDGFDRTLQVNHLAPFLLTELLMERLVASKASIIQTSSSVARLLGPMSTTSTTSAGGAPARRTAGPSSLTSCSPRSSSAATASTASPRSASTPGPWGPASPRAPPDGSS